MQTHRMVSYFMIISMFSKLMFHWKLMALYLIVNGDKILEGNYEALASMSAKIVMFDTFMKMLNSQDYKEFEKFDVVIGDIGHEVMESM